MTSARSKATATWLSFLRSSRGGVALHHALVLSAISLVALAATHHVGQKITAPFEAIQSALQKQGGWQRLAP